MDITEPTKKLAATVSEKLARLIAVDANAARKLAVSVIGMNRFDDLLKFGLNNQKAELVSVHTLREQTAQKFRVGYAGKLSLYTSRPKTGPKVRTILQELRNALWDQRQHLTQAEFAALVLPVFVEGCFGEDEVYAVLSRRVRETVEGLQRCGKMTHLDATSLIMDVAINWTYPEVNMGGRKILL